MRNIFLTFLVCFLSMMLLGSVGTGVAVAGVTEAWVRHYNGSGGSSDVARAIAVDSAGNVYVTGSSYGIATSTDYATIKYDPAGNEVWVRRYDGIGNGSDSANAITVDSAGNVYVTGDSFGGSTSGSDYTTIKYDAAGNEVWVRRYNGIGNRPDLAYAIAVDNAGNVYVTGQSVGVSGNYDYATIKYDPAGNEVWVRRYDGPGNGGDSANAIALDSAGNICVTGDSDGGLTDSDYATIKYDPAGNEIWVRRYNGPTNSGDIASAIALDNVGNVCVTGTSYSVATSTDYTTIKYDAAGNEVWVQSYDGPASDSDAARAIAVDSAGNVYVTGDSFSAFTNSDYTTIKYDPAGNQVWVQYYNGPASSADYAYSIAVDGAGNVYVTGGSDSGYTSTGGDYATIMYDPAGNEVWVQRL